MKGYHEPNAVVKDINGHTLRVGDLCMVVNDEEVAGRRVYVRAFCTNHGGKTEARVDDSPLPSDPFEQETRRDDWRWSGWISGKCLALIEPKEKETA